MSYFGAKLAELLDRNKMRASELSRISGINDALVYRWVNGQQLFVAHDDLAKIVIALTSSPVERAELIRAHLLDEMGDAKGKELIQIVISGGAAKKPKITP